MKRLDMIILLIILIIIMMRPSLLIDFINTFLGKCLMLALIIISSQYSKFIPIFLAILYIYVSEIKKESFEMTDLKAMKKLVKLKKKNCRNGKFVKGNGNIPDNPLELAKLKYPNLSFDDESCGNPCSVNCKVTLAS